MFYCLIFELSILFDTQMYIETPSTSVSKPARRRSTLSESARIGQTLGQKFRRQLKELLNNVSTTTPHYVRCIKPNPENIPDKFDAELVLAQLKCCGVIEAVKVSRAGFPNRMPYREFYMGYQQLLGKLTAAHYKKEERTRSEMQLFCDELVNQLLKNDKIQASTFSGAHKENQSGELLEKTSIQVGTSLVFLRRTVFDLLEQKKAVLQRRAVIIIQAQCRSFLLRRWFRLARAKVLILQCFVRVAQAKKLANVRRMLRASFVIQRVVRGWRARCRVGVLYVSIVRIQCFLRRIRSVEQLAQRRRSRCATIIATMYRRYELTSPFMCM